MGHFKRLSRLLAASTGGWKMASISLPEGWLRLHGNQSVVGFEPECSSSPGNRLARPSSAG